MNRRRNGDKRGQKEIKQRERRGGRGEERRKSGGEGKGRRRDEKESRDKMISTERRKRQ